MLRAEKHYLRILLDSHRMSRRPEEHITGTHRLMAPVLVCHGEFAFNEIAPMRCVAKIICKPL
jgi:hypothetical protein